jgi:hypothetical protein
MKSWLAAIWLSNGSWRCAPNSGKPMTKRSQKSMGQCINCMAMRKELTSRNSEGSKQKLPEVEDWQKLELVKDIERLGGRSTEFEELCESNLELYGGSGSTKRRSFQKARYNLQRQRIQSYWEYLLANGITPHSTTSDAFQRCLLLKDQRSPKAKQAIMDDSTEYDDDDYADDEDVDETTSARTPVRPAPAPTSAVRFQHLGGGGRFGGSPTVGGRGRASPPVRGPPGLSAIGVSGRGAASPSPARALSRTPVIPTGPSRQSAEEQDSLNSALAAMSVGEAPAFFPKGSIQNPIVVLVDPLHPEAHQGFFIERFPAQLCRGHTRTVWEIRLVVFVGDVDIWEASVPSSGVPLELQGHIIDIKGPSVNFWLRYAERYNTAANLGCQATEIARKQTIREIKEDQARNLCHWRVVFPSSDYIDHRIFSEQDDLDEAVHKTLNGMKLLGDDSVNNPWVDSDLLGVVAAWRVALQTGVRPVGKDSKKTDTRSLFATK